LRWLVLSTVAAIAVADRVVAAGGVVGCCCFLPGVAGVPFREEREKGSRLWSPGVTIASHCEGGRRCESERERQHVWELQLPLSGRCTHVERLPLSSKELEATPTRKQQTTTTTTTATTTTTTNNNNKQQQQQQQQTTTTTITTTTTTTNNNKQQQHATTIHKPQHTTHNAHISHATKIYAKHTLHEIPSRGRIQRAWRRGFGPPSRCRSGDHCRFGGSNRQAVSNRHTTSCFQPSQATVTQATVTSNRHASQEGAHRCMIFGFKPCK